MMTSQLISKLEADHVGCTELCMLLEKISGIHVVPDQKGLIFMANRLGRVLGPRKLVDYRSYINLLKKGEAAIIAEFISAMTTNTTHFFRENEHFIHLKETLPTILKRKQASGENELRIWCAASSTGQEPYSIAMTALEAISAPMQWKLKMLASDIDNKVLNRASQGEYTEAEMESVSPAMRQKYFQKTQVKGEAMYRVQPALVDLVRFAMVNLHQENYSFQHKFDIIFCRNILIYFKLETVEQVMNRLMNALSPNGILYVGHTESAMIKTNGLRRVAAAVYQREPLVLARAS